MNKSPLMPLGRFLIPLALTASLSGCAVISAQKMAGEGNRLAEQDKLDQAMARYDESIKTRDNDTAHAGKAEVLMRQGNYAEAEKQAKQAIELAPTVDAYKLILAKAYLLQGNGTQAYEQAQDVVKALSGSMSDPPSKALVKRALLMKARIVEATSKPEDAEKIVSDPETQARWPDDRDFRAELAVVRALEGKYEDATQLADSVLKLNANQGDAKLAKGIVLASNGKSTEAKELLDKSLRDDHTRVMVFLQVARKMRADKKNADAIYLLKELEAIQPQNYLIHYELAIAYLDTDKLQESIEEHEKTLATYPSLQPYVTQKTLEELARAIKDTPPSDFDRKNLVGFYQNLSTLYARKGDADRSIEYLERVAAVEPTLDAYQSLAATYDKKGDTTSAIRSLEAATRLAPENSELYKSLGAEYFKAKQPDKAMEAFRKALAGKSNDAEGHLNLGIILYNAKQYKEAQGEFESAVKLNPENVDATYYLGLSQKQAKDNKAAEATFRKVVQMKVDYPDAYKELGNLALERKAYKDAEKFFALEDQYRGKAPAAKGKKK